MIVEASSIPNIWTLVKFVAIPVVTLISLDYFFLNFQGMFIMINLEYNFLKQFVKLNAFKFFW